MKQPVHVTVQMDTVGIPVKVSVHIACMGSKNLLQSFSMFLT